MLRYRMDKDGVEAAVFGINDPEKIMKSEVDSLVRWWVGSKTLGRMRKEALSKELSAHLKSAMKDYGYDVEQVLVTAFCPEQVIIDAINDVGEAKRKLVSAKEKGEADKVIKV